MPESHSTIIGGSSADRVLSCPGSNRLIGTLPEWAQNRTSKYASAGTACHTVMADMLINDSELPAVGTVVDGVEITEQMRLGIRFAIDQFDALLEAYPDMEFLIEQRVRFPAVLGAFGTVDVIGYSRAANLVVVLDWKFGAGLAIRACYDLDDGFEKVNAQLLYYAAAARETLPHMFPRGSTIMLRIVQPLVDAEEGRVTTAMVSHEELDQFEADVATAVYLAATDDAPLVQGPHCRFCPAKAICPTWTAPLAGLVERRKAQLPELSNEELGHLLNVADMAQEIIRDIQQLAYGKLERGEVIAGWKLVPKQPRRQWQAPDEAVLKALRKLRVRKADALETKLKSPAAIERVLKKGQALPDGLALPVSGGPTLAPSDDPRPDVQESVNKLRELAKRNLRKQLASSLFK